MPYKSRRYKRCVRALRRYFLGLTRHCSGISSQRGMSSQTDGQGSAWGTTHQPGGGHELLASNSLVQCVVLVQCVFVNGWIERDISPHLLLTETNLRKSGRAAQIPVSDAPCTCGTCTVARAVCRRDTTHQVGAARVAAMGGWFSRFSEDRAGLRSLCLTKREHYSDSRAIQANGPVASSTNAVQLVHTYPHPPWQDPAL